MFSSYVNFSYLAKHVSFVTKPFIPGFTKSENYWKKNKKIKIIFSYVNLKSAVFGSKFVDLHQGPEIHPVGSRGIGKWQNV